MNFPALIKSIIVILRRKNIKSTKYSMKYLLSKSESVKFLLIESVIYLFTDSPVKKYILLLNQLIITN